MFKCRFTTETHCESKVPVWRKMPSVSAGMAPGKCLGAGNVFVPETRSRFRVNFDLLVSVQLDYQAADCL